MRRIFCCIQKIDSRGVASIEFALIFPVFLTLIFGIIEISRLMWWEVGLQRAAAVASRCGGIRAPDCETDPQIAAKAVNSVPGIPFKASDFIIVRENCGVRVTANVTFKFVIGFLGLPDQPLNATFCHPLT